MKKRKTWREKLLDDKGLPKIGGVEGKMSTRWGEGTMVVPAPIEVKEMMDQVEWGELATINDLREALAKKHGVDIACPITTGIFAWIAAHAAEEEASEGKKTITPYWRIVKNGGELNPKYPGGIAGLTEKLREEGHSVVEKGKRFLVKDFGQRLSRG